MNLDVRQQGFVAIVTINRPPYNFLDMALVEQLADALEELDCQQTCRAVVLAAEGKAFCAGGNFSADGGEAFATGRVKSVYEEAVRLFSTRKPIVAAVHGAAIGGGLGLALTADFRVTCPEAKFAASFTRLGVNPGFALLVTLPELIGRNKAELMFYTGRTVRGLEALASGLANVVVPREHVRQTAIDMAHEMADCAPLAVASTRHMMRAGLVERIRAAASETMREQGRLRSTEDFREGVKANAEHRKPVFRGS
ncbi:enoyl-CoA hydratase/isomerase family protein [Comamonadaceae bacterium G21597-S1]|nr:enoyl-CoA hydratase/isomerase family protein [Comamonadaceae bacterium G21597-S1]